MFISIHQLGQMNYWHLTKLPLQKKKTLQSMSCLLTYSLASVLLKTVFNNIQWVASLLIKRIKKLTLTKNMLFWTFRLLTVGNRRTRN